MGAVDRAQTVAQLRRVLKPQLLRRLFHLGTEVGDKLVALAVEYEHGLGHAAAVVLRAAALYAPAGAGPHLVVEARPFLADIPREAPRAVRQQERLADGIYYLVRLSPAAEGAEVSRAVLARAADDGHHRVLAARVDTDEGIALVILEEDIVVGLVALYERVFKHQRLELAASDDDVEVVYFFALPT